MGDPSEVEDSFESTVGVRLRFSEIFSDTGGRDELVGRLKKCSLATVLDYLGRASAILYKDGNRTPATQRYLCEVFFRSHAGYVWKMVQMWKAKSSRSAMTGLVVLFDEATIAVTAKLALQHCHPSAETTADSIRSLGEVMLMVNELIDESAPLEIDRATIDGQDAWAYYVYVLSAFQSNDDDLHALARSADLFLRDKPHLSGTPNYVDLPERVKLATGLDSSTLWSILFAYFAHFISIDTSNAHLKHAFVDTKTYFADYSFSEADIAAFMRILSQSQQSAVEGIQRTHSTTSLRSYDNFVIARAPLIEIEGRAYCPVLRLLFERVTSGLYHILLNATPEDTKADRASRDRYQQYMGDVFEDYTDRLIRRVVDTRRRTGKAIPVYLGPRDLRSFAPTTKKGMESQICDHLIWDGTSAVLWDSKAKFLPLKARVGEDRQEFISRFGNLVDKAARQLSATARLLRDGAFASYGIEPTEIRHIFPAVVSLADYSIQPHLQVWIDNRLSRQGLFQAEGSHPLEILMSSDLEKLESSWEDGTEIADILLAKLQNPEWRQHSMHNFIALSGDVKLVYGRSSYLRQTFQELTESAEGFFASKQNS